MPKPANNSGRRAAEIFRKAAPKAFQKKEDNVILRLLNGELSLTRTFWFFCLSIPLAGDLVFSYLLFPMLDLSRTKECLALIIWVLAIAFYMFIANIGLWRSAARNANPRLVMLGKFASVLGILAAFAYVIRWYSIWMIVSE